MPEYDETVESEHTRRGTSAPSPDPAAGVGGAEVLGARKPPGRQLGSARMVLSMQRQAGNAATVQLLTQSEDGAGHEGHDHEGDVTPLQRDTDPSADPGSGGAGAPPADAQSSGSADAPDISQFDTDAVVSAMAEQGESQEGAGDLAPGDPANSGGSAPPTAQAMFLQRDPTPGPPGGAPAAQGGSSATKPGNVGDVLAALASTPEFKAALEALKDMVAKAWKDYQAGTDTSEKVFTFTVAAALAGGAAAGAMSNPSTRKSAIDMANGVKIPLDFLSPLPGLSVTPLTGNGGIQGGTVGLDVLKAFPGLKKTPLFN